MNLVHFGTFNTFLLSSFCEKEFWTPLHIDNVVNFKAHSLFLFWQTEHFKWTVSRTGKKKQHSTVPYQCCGFILRIWQQCYSISLRLTGSDKACRQKKREHPGNRRTGAALIVSLEGTLILSIRLPAHFMARSDPHWCGNGCTDSGISMCAHTCAYTCLFTVLFQCVDTRLCF